MTARRRFNAAVAVPVALALATASATPATADSLDSCYPVAGHVRDGLGRPLAGARASVATSCNGPNAVTTGADGRYVLYVAGGSLGATANVSVVKPGYVPRSQSTSVKPKVGAKPVPVIRATEMDMASRSAAGPLPESGLALYREEDVEPSNTDFTLLLAFAPTVAPAAVRPGETVTFTVTVAAPPPGHPGNATRVVATRTHDGAEVPLAPSAPAADGSTTWTGTTTVAAGEADGNRAVAACAAGPDHTGPCSAAPAGTLLSAVVSRGYAVDATPPVLESADPVAYGTYSSLYTVTARWKDATSGLAASAPFRVYVDGAARPVSVSGTTAYASLSGLPRGIHTLELEATDRAGNVARVVRIFTLAPLSATPATATLRRQTVPVNPGASVPTPATVRFPAPKVDVGAFTETIGANTWVGYGQLRRPFTFVSAQVEFVNETGVPKVVTVYLPTGYATHDVALLTPSASAAVARVPEQVVTIGDVNVAVPTGYGTPGSQATLRSLVAWLGPPESPSAQLAGARFTGRVNVVGSIASCASNDPETVQCDDGMIRANGMTAAVPRGRFDDHDLSIAPHCEDADGTPEGEGCAAAKPDRTAKARVAFGCAETHVANLNGVTVEVNLCDIQPALLAAGQAPPPAPEAPFAAASLNGWVYTVRDAAEGTLFPSLQQSHVDAPKDGGACPNGLAGAATSWVYRGAANVAAADGATVPEHVGVWRPKVAERMLPPHVTVRLGREHGPFATDGGVAELALREERTYQLTSPRLQPLWSDTGDYHLVPGALVNGFGVRAKVAGATSSVWEYEPGSDAPVSGLAGTSGSLELVNGTTFTDAPIDGYQRVFSLDFQLVADFSGCG